MTKRQPLLELGAIWKIEESNKVSQIKRYYFGDHDLKVGVKPDEKVLKRQKLIRNGIASKHDAEITVKFAADLRKIVDGERDEWYNDVDGVLAIIILMQFFTKCMFREDPRAYRFDEEAIELSRYII